MKIITVIAAFAAVYCIFKAIPSVFKIAANNAFSNGDCEKAVELYKKAYVISGKKPYYGITYAILLMRAESFFEAENVLNEMILKGMKPTDKLSAKVFRCMAWDKLGKNEDALEEAEELFEQCKNTQTYSLLGYLRQKNGDSALDFCLEAYEYNSDDRDICDNLTAAYIMNGDWKEAEKLASLLRKKYPEFVEGFYRSAVIARQCGDFKKAAEYAESAANGKRNGLTTVSREEIQALREEIENAGI